MTDVTFLSLPYTRDGPERFRLPLITGDANTVENVNLPQAWEDMTELVLDLPYIGSCNYTYAVIGSHGFWIQDYAFVANKLNTVRWQFIRDPWPDFIDKRVWGTWDALPTRTAPYLKDVLANAELVPAPSPYSITGNIPTIGVMPGQPSEKPFWVCVTLKRSLKENKKGLFQYGGIVTSELSRNLKTPSSSSGGAVQSTYKYPSLGECISELDTILNGIATANNAGNVTVDDIIDVSISERCPFACSITASAGVYHAVINNLRDLENYPHSSVYGLFDISPSYAPEKRTLSLNINEAVAVFGQVHVRDINANTVAVLNTDHLHYFLEFLTISDISGTYTEITVKLDDANGKIIQIIRLPEGHLPFLGNAWNTYNAYERAYDRESMQLNIQSANANAVLNAGTSVVSGAVTGALVGNLPGAAVGGVSALIGMGSNLYANQMEREKLEALQDLKEEQYRLMPSSSNNVAYGLFYARAGHKAEIVALMPESITSTMINYYLMTHGYPASGRKQVWFNQPGFYRGRVTQVTDVPSLTNKRLIGLLNTELLRGIYLSIV